MMQAGKHQTAYLAAFWKEIEQEGALLRERALPPLLEKDFFLFEKTGNRLVYENVYFARRKFLTVFGILSEFGNRREDLAKLENVIVEVCAERFWALPAHVDFAHLDETTIDLFAAETAQTLAELLVVLGERLSPFVAALAKQEITRRVLAPFCESTVPYSWWETDRCNWSAVCAGSIGMAAVYMDRMGALEPAWKNACIKRVCDALGCYLDGMEEDGACTEGLGYFSYGMSYYTAFAELLYEETGKKVNLMDHPKCARIAAFQEMCYFGQGVSLSFSDGSDTERFLPGLTAYLSHCFAKVKTPPFTAARRFCDDACYRWLPNERNIRWLLAYGGAAVCAGTDFSSCDILPAAQWMICKNKRGNGFAAKGGHNDENHNHNDVGHFLCVYNGELLLTDLGAGEYTKDYFGEGRYGILCNRSLGHSVPLVNDLEQCQGKQYRADAFVWDKERRKLEISFAAAYPCGCIDRISRIIRMEDESDLRLCVTDCFVRTKDTKKITENLVTPFAPVICDAHTVVITGERGGCSITAACRENEDEPWQQAKDLRIVPKEHARHDGSKTTVYLIQWETLAECRMQISCYSDVSGFALTEKNGLGGKIR